jgi:hypothetical protein
MIMVMFCPATVVVGFTFWIVCARIDKQVAHVKSNESSSTRHAL